MTNQLETARKAVVAAIDDASADLIGSLMRPIELPSRSKLMAFQWRTPTAAEPRAACAAIPGYEADSIKP